VKYNLELWSHNINDLSTIYMYVSVIEYIEFCEVIMTAFPFSDSRKCPFLHL
jgi:hypothetical protein